MNQVNAGKKPRRRKPVPAGPVELPNRMLSIKDLAAALGRNPYTVLAVLVLKGERLIKFGKCRVVEPSVAQRMAEHLRDYDRRELTACGKA